MAAALAQQELGAATIPEAVPDGATGTSPCRLARFHLPDFTIFVTSMRRLCSWLASRFNVVAADWGMRIRL
jgi:hypothetical protein